MILPSKTQNDSLSVINSFEYDSNDAKKYVYYRIKNGTTDKIYFYSSVCTILTNIFSNNLTYLKSIYSQIDTSYNNLITDNPIASDTEYNS